MHVLLPPPLTHHHHHYPHVVSCLTRVPAVPRGCDESDQGKLGGRLRGNSLSLLPPPPRRGELMLCIAHTDKGGETSPASLPTTSILVSPFVDYDGKEKKVASRQRKVKELSLDERDLSGRKMVRKGD